MGCLFSRNGVIAEDEPVSLSSPPAYEDVEKDVWYQMGARLWYRIDDYQTYMMRMHRDLVAEGRLKLRRARSPGGRLSLAPRGTLGG